MKTMGAVTLLYNIVLYTSNKRESINTLVPSSKTNQVTGPGRAPVQIRRESPHVSSFLEIATNGPTSGKQTVAWLRQVKLPWREK